MKSIAIMIGQLVHGGSERQLYSFLANSDRTYWNPNVFVSGALGLWEKPIRDLGIPITLLHGGRLDKMLQFRAACAATGSEVFFSWSSHTNGFGLALAGSRVHRIGSFRNALFSDLPVRLRKLWEWSSLAGVSTIVCNSKEAKLACKRESDRHDVFYVPNAVDVFPEQKVQEWRASWRKRLDVDEETPLIVGVGRLTPQKKFSRFIEVVARVAERFPVRAVIAGPDCGCMAELQQQISALGLERSVRLLGAVPEARELICAADVFLLSSDHEGMPNVLLEAMAAAVPCVTTPVNSVRDIIVSEQSGYVSSYDPAELAHCVSRLIEDRTLRRAIGKEARLRVETAHDPGNISATLWNICDQKYTTPSEP